MNRPLDRRLVAAALALVLLFPPRAAAQSTWNNPIGGSWNDTPNR